MQTIIACLRIIALGASLCIGFAQAAVVKYTTTPLGGGIWHYEYELSGPAPTGGFDGVTIYFAPTSFGQLSNLSVSADWDGLLIQPDSSIPADGLADLLHLGGLITSAIDPPIAFSLDVEYLGSGAPGSQSFELYVLEPFEIVESGQTVAASVPEPASAMLAASALALLYCLSWMRREDFKRKQMTPAA